MKSVLATSWKGEFLALLAGLILPFSFAPFEFFPLAVIAPALFLYSILFATQKRALARGFLFGIGQFSVGVSWIYVSIHLFGDIPIIIAFLLTTLFIILFSIYPALSAYFLQRFFTVNNATKLVCAFPAIALLSEWVRGWFFSGFPWLDLGYSQTNSPLKGLAPLIGSYGISLAVLITAGLIVFGLLGSRHRRVHALGIIIFIWVLSGIFSLLSWTTPRGDATRVSLVQGNVEQSLKWDPKRIAPTLALYQELTEKEWGQSSLIIWPETAIPVLQRDAEVYLNQLNEQAKQHHASIIVGIPIEDAQQKIYNGALILGEGYGEYRKRRLVPFGEYLPNLFWLPNIYRTLKLEIPMLSPGPFIQGKMMANGLPIAPFICYEIAFPEQVRLFLGDATVLLTQTDDTWFGHSLAPAQHLQMGKMRALETGRPLLFVGNSGITAFIDARGHITAEAPPFQTTVLRGIVQGMAGKTPWLYAGNNTVLLLALIFLGLAGRREFLLRARME